MLEIVENKSTFSFIEERDWYIGELKLREMVIEEQEETHYNNGYISKDKYVYYIRLDDNGKVCSGQISNHWIIRELSIQRCVDAINSVDWNEY